MNDGVRRSIGCGLGSLVAIVLIVAVVGWALSLLTGTTSITPRQPVPDNVPPAAGAEEIGRAHV